MRDGAVVARKAHNLEVVAFESHSRYQGTTNFFAVHYKHIRIQLNCMGCVCLM